MPSSIHHDNPNQTIQSEKPLLDGLVKPSSVAGSRKSKKSA